MFKKTTLLLLLCFFFSLLACQTQEIRNEPTITWTQEEHVESTSTFTPSSTTTKMIETPTLANALCFPLKDLSYSDLSSNEININPFATPSISLDDGHHGMDIAFWEYKNFTTMEGLPIRSIFSGKVAAVVSDRIPYGNMIIIETPITDISESILSKFPLPTPAPIAINDGRLTCPDFSNIDTINSKRSLYVLYAHMLESPVLNIGESVEPCQEIGSVGNTGESSQFHLHLEVRVGPSGYSFSSISHRNTAATIEEMNNYCIWRVSNIFQMLDPLMLLSQIP